MNEIRVFAPATVANVGSGFDVLGFALSDIGDIITVRKTDHLGLHIKSIEGADNLPLDSKKNVSTVAAQALLDSYSNTLDFGFEFELVKKVSAGSGMGSSASSSAAAIMAVNELLGRPYSKTELVVFAMQGESLASGTPHADNVAPSLLGGFTLIQSYDPLRIIPLHYPKDLVATVVHPHIEVKTSDSKRILRQHIPLKTAITQWANVGGLVAGLAQENYELIGHSLKDVVAEPTRSILIPLYEQVKEMAHKNGALGCNISGSGPSMFMLSQSLDTAHKLADELRVLYSEEQLDCDVYVSNINPDGAILL
jgi:homoserine kinase